MQDHVGSVPARQVFNTEVPTATRSPQELCAAMLALARERRAAGIAICQGHPDLGRVRARRSEARVSRRPTLAEVSRYGSAWLLVVAGGVLAVACVSIASTAPAAIRPWAAVAAGFSLTVLGIILVAIRRAERRDDSEDGQ